MSPKPYYDTEIRVFKGLNRIAQFAFPRHLDIGKCLIKCISSPQAILRLKKRQIAKRNRPEDDCLGGNLAIEVWEVAGDSSGNEVYSKILRKFLMDDQLKLTEVKLA